VPPGQLDTALRAVHAATPKRDVRIKADRYLPYGTVRKVLRSLDEAGFSRARLLTWRRDSAGASL
jgi:biopolymer transport protein ExbD